MKCSIRSTIPQPVPVLPVGIPLRNQKPHTNIVELLSVAAIRLVTLTLLYCDNQMLSLHLLTEYPGMF